MSSGNGTQRPRIDHSPKYVRSRGFEAIELAALAGLYLDDWQQYVLTKAMGETSRGSWSARTVGLMVSRQNGKGALLEARELAGLFLLEEPMIVHTAHLQDTANGHFRRLVDRIKNTPVLGSRLAKPGGILRGHGTESINLAVNPKPGIAPRLEVRTRTGSGGLGFSINCLIFDESMIISDAMHQALLPTLSAQPNMQVWYTGSAVDQENPSHQGVPFARVREQGIAKTHGMAYFEWSLPVDDPDKIVLEDIAGEDLEATNPGLGIRISEDYIRESEFPGLGGRGAAVQRLGVGSWPRTDGLDNVVITPTEWGEWTDKASQITGPVCVSVDVGPDRDRSAIAVCGFRSDEKLHVEVVERKRGRTATVGLVEYVCKLTSDHTVLAVIVDGRSPANSLVPELTEKLPIGELHDREVTVLTATEHAQACGMLYDAGQQDRLRHVGQPELAEALRGAIKRPLTDAWAWHRLNSTVDISPLVAITLALYGAEVFQPGVPQFWSWDEIEKLAEEAA